MTIFACVNTFNRWEIEKQGEQIGEVAKEADVITLQELSGDIKLVLPDGWHSKQMFRDNGDPSGEAVIWSPAVHVARTGGRYACGPDAAGLNQRFYPWADVIIPNVATVRVPSVHMPPRRDGLEVRQGPKADSNLRVVVRRARWRGVQWMPGGDWNERLSNDPAELNQRLNGQWRGHRIDGFCVSPRLAKHVRSTIVAPNGRNDNHDVIYVNIR